MRRRYFSHKTSRYVILVDILAILHFVACNTVIVMGELLAYLGVISKVKWLPRYNQSFIGLDLIYGTVDYPVYRVAAELGLFLSSDPVVEFCIAEMIIAFSSVFYAVVVALFVKMLFALLGR